MHPAPDDRAQVIAAIRDIIATHLALDPADVPVDGLLLALPAIDSLKALQIALAIEKHFDIRFAEDQITAVRTVGEVADLVLATLAGARP